MEVSMSTLVSSQIESRFEKELKWPDVGKIPNFPARNFPDVKEKVEMGQFDVGVDNTVANYTAAAVHKGLFRPIFIIWLNMQVILAALAVVLSIIMKDYALLLGVPLVFLSEIVSNPYNPFRGFLSKLAIVISLYALHGFYFGASSGTYLAALFIVNFWGNRGFYRHNRNLLERIALNSEKILIYLYQTGSLFLRNNMTGETYHSMNTQI
jgi:hypothetical protein